MKNLIANIVAKFKMFAGQFEVKFCPNCKVRMSICYRNWGDNYITRECPCCKGTLMTPYGETDYGDEDEFTLKVVPAEEIVEK